MKAPSKFNSIRSFFRPAVVAGSVMLAMAAAAPTHARAESTQQQITVQIVDPGGNPVAVQSAYILPPEPRAPIATGLDPVELPPNGGAYTLRITIPASNTDSANRSGDYTGDGVVDLRDATAILQVVNGGRP